METAKLRKLDSTKSLSSYELELLNWNFWAIEQALSSVGALTPSSTVSTLTIPIRHDQLQELDDDDHLQYLLLNGRIGGQVVTRPLLSGTLGLPTLTVLVEDGDYGFKVSKIGGVSTDSTFLASQFGNTSKVQIGNFGGSNAIYIDADAIGNPSFIYSLQSVAQIRFASNEISLGRPISGWTSYLRLNTDLGIRIDSVASNQIPLKVFGTTSQSVNLQDWRSVGDITLAAITKDGYVSTRQFLLNGTTSGRLTHIPAAITTSYSLTWPAASADGVLVNTGGILSWASSAPPGAHTHPASDITSGTFDIARIPDLSSLYSIVSHDHAGVYSLVGHIHAATDITSGILAIGRIPDLSSLYSIVGHDHDSDYSLLGHIHAAADTTSGTFNIARIPDLSSLYSVVGHTHSYSSLGHTHDSADITSGVLAVGRIPDLSATYSVVAHTHTFASLTSKPTTIGGYGITDFNSLGDARWSLLAHVHTFDSLTSKPTTLAGYGITSPLSVTEGGTGANTFPVGAILFGDTTNPILTDSVNLFWDNTNKRLGIGKVPSLKLDVETADVVAAAAIRSTNVGGFSEFRAVNNSGTANDRVAFGVGGTGAGSTYGNNGYMIASFNIDNFLFSTAKAGAMMKFRAGSSTVDRRVIGPTKTLSNNTLTPLFNCTIANDTAIAGSGEYKVEIRDGANLQIEIGSFQYYATKIGAAAIANLQTFQTGVQTLVTAGTLVVTLTITGSGNTATLNINANSSLSPSAGFPRIDYELRNLTQQVVVFV